MSAAWPPAKPGRPHEPDAFEGDRPRLITAFGGRFDVLAGERAAEVICLVNFVAVLITALGSILYIAMTSGHWMLAALGIAAVGVGLLLEMLAVRLCLEVAVAIIRIERRGH